MAFSAPASAQDCTPDDITLSNQVEIDNFQANHGPCDRVVTDLIIAGRTIANLDGMSGVSSIGGWLSVRGNDILTNL